MIATAFRHQLKVQRTIDEFSHELFLPPGDAADLKISVLEFLKTYTELGQIADLRGQLLWSMVPKCHWYWHFAHRAQFLCPRRGACLIDEDYVGRVKVVSYRGTRGRASSALACVPLFGIRFATTVGKPWGSLRPSIRRVAMNNGYCCCALFAP